MVLTQKIRNLIIVPCKHATIRWKVHMECRCTDGLLRVSCNCLICSHFIFVQNKMTKEWVFFYIWSRIAVWHLQQNYVLFRSTFYFKNVLWSPDYYKMSKVGSTVVNIRKRLLFFVEGHRILNGNINSIIFCLLLLIFPNTHYFEYSHNANQLWNTVGPSANRHECNVHRSKALCCHLCCCNFTISE